MRAILFGVLALGLLLGAGTAVADANPPQDPPASEHSAATAGSTTSVGLDPDPGSSCRPNC